MKKRLVVGVILASIMLAGCCVSHEWQEATCTTPKTCNKCQEVEGEPLGHTWTDATCTESKKCNTCGEAEGEALGHDWTEATYEAPKTCNICKITEGDVLSTDAEYIKGRNFLYGLEGNEVNLELAYNHFMQAKDNGNVDANFYLGLLCDDYSYPEQDFEQAKSYYEASGDNPYSKIALGFLYLNGQGVEEDQAKAKELFQAAIDSGCVEGYCGLGDIAAAAADYETEWECFNKVVEGTEPVYVAYADYAIGYMYYCGNGVEQDHGRALEWFEKAADLGHDGVMALVGSMYFYGDGVTQDYGKALEWFEKAAELGDDTAMTYIGGIYCEGLGVTQDYEKGLEWYLKASGLGNAAAMREIGYMYQKGEGVAQDYAKALEWYEKAANLGDDFAMNEIGYMYGQGMGVTQDYAKALEWHEKAADLGNAEAMYNAGYLYEAWGGTQDFAKALSWYEKAAAAGFEEAEWDVERIKSYLQ